MRGGALVAVPFISTSCGTKTTNFDSLSDYEKYVDRWLTDTNEYKTIDSDNLDDLK
ncbi:hypothetical protein FACS1894166_11700 [Bacilli bacterium]|nr:hypothetical protein FACS1894166_11700 [Bacilli bacterium]